MIYDLYIGHHLTGEINAEPFCEIRCAPSRLKEVADKVSRYYRVIGADGKVALESKPEAPTKPIPTIELYKLMSPMDADFCFPGEDGEPPAELPDRGARASDVAHELIKDSLNLDVSTFGTWTPAISGDQRSEAFGVMELGLIGHLDFAFPHAIIRVTFLYWM